MRVYCIVRHDWEIEFGPVFGDTDEVIRELYRWEERYYELERFKGTAFIAREFVPLPDAEPEAITEEETLLTTV